VPEPSQAIPAVTAGSRIPGLGPIALDVELSPELVREQAYLIAKGVRPMALMGTCVADPTTMLRVTSQLEIAAEPNAIPFVLDRGDGLADFGYAASSWALDLFQWITRDDGLIPAHHKHRIRGLLLGYGVEAIRAFEERSCGRLFEEPVRPLSS
jgi:hypothetical protein